MNNNRPKVEVISKEMGGVHIHAPEEGRNNTHEQ